MKRTFSFFCLFFLCGPATLFAGVEIGAGTTIDPKANGQFGFRGGSRPVQGVLLRVGEFSTGEVITVTVTGAVRLIPKTVGSGPADLISDPRGVFHNDTAITHADHGITLDGTLVSAGDFTPVHEHALIDSATPNPTEIGTKLPYFGGVFGNWHDTPGEQNLPSAEAKNSAAGGGGKLDRENNFHPNHVTSGDYLQDDYFTNFLGGTQTSYTAGTVTGTMISGINGGSLTFTFTAPNAGALYLGVNDTFFNNNAGDFFVTASSTPPPPATIPEPATLAVWSILGGLGLIQLRRMKKKNTK